MLTAYLLHLQLGMFNVSHARNYFPASAFSPDYAVGGCNDKH